MFEHINYYYSKLDNKIKIIMHYGFIFSFVLMIISCFVLFTYLFFYNSPILFYIGLSIFKLGLVYFIAFFCFGFAFNKIMEEI